MARKDGDGFNVGQWGQEPVQLYELDHNSMTRLDHILNELERFCNEKRLPMFVGVGVAETHEKLRMAQRTVFPYGRTNVAVLAANLMCECGISEYSINVLKEMHSLDVERNVEYLEKDKAAQERRAAFNVITNPES